MGVYRTLAVLALIFLVSLGAAAAPAGKVVIAQGVDPTTLDMMNQSETPASNLGRHIFDTLYERDQSLKVVPALATEMPKLVGPTTWEVKLRKGVKFHNGEDFDAESAKWGLERLAGGQGKLRGSTFFPALQNGEIDGAVNIPPHLVPVIDKHPRLFLSTAPSIRTIQLMFYAHQMDAQHKPVGPYSGPTADKRVRQAIAYAIDADEIIRTVLDGKGIRVATMLPSMHFGYDPSLRPIKQDVERAKKLLAEAGFAGGVEITLHGPRGRYVRDVEVAEAVTGQLTKAGIKTTLRTYDFVTYLNNMVYVHKAGPVWLIGWGTGTMDAETIYVPLFKSPGIFVNWHNEEFNRMVDEAQAIMDDRKRLEQYHRINKLWVEETPAVPLYQQLDLYGVSKRINWKARSDEVIQAFTMSLKE